jgi:mRNA-degrading endonuclease RelE of RelBE toxin-antitoxin system
LTIITHGVIFYLYKVELFIRGNQSCIVQDWLDSIGKKPAAIIFSKLRMLEVEGLNLLKTNVLKRIVGEADLYEIRAGRYRILTYYDKDGRKFILLNGFTKQKMNERGHILIGIQLKEEYLSAG